MNDLMIFARRLRLSTLQSSRSVPHHLGGSFSCVEIITVLFKRIMRLDAPRDFFILSKGHAAMPYYHVLAACGLIDMQAIEEMGKPNGILLGHPCASTTKAIDFSTGSLGMGLSFAAGVSYGLQLKNDPRRTFVIIGDGELQCGIVWEALLFISQHRLRNLVVIVDQNDLQSDGPTSEILSVSKVPEMLHALGLDVTECDGHDMEELISVLSRQTEAAHVVFAKTIKGKGVEMMENRAEWHSGELTHGDYLRALNCLEGLPGAPSVPSCNNSGTHHSNEAAGFDKQMRQRVSDAALTSEMRNR